MNFYINGELATSATGRNSFTPTTTGTWNLGQDFSGVNNSEFLSRALMGWMADFVVYPDAILPSEARNIYRNGVGGSGSTPPPVLTTGFYFIIN
jgi:hypothetical protein